MLKFWSILLGKDFELISTYRRSSQEKIILFGSILMIPVILWGLNGYLMSKEIFGMGVISSMVVGLILSFIIYLIERSIILASNNEWVNRMRVLLGLIVAILGSLTMDEVIFKNDIDQMMQVYKIEGVDSEEEYRKNRELVKQDVKDNFNDKGLLIRMKALFR